LGQAASASNPYDDEVQTVHSEGVRSEVEPPPLPAAKRPNGRCEAGVGHDSDNESPTTLGDISEADDRVSTGAILRPQHRRCMYLLVGRVLLQSIPLDIRG
jgi:hypothetical protein